MAATAYREPRQSAPSGFFRGGCKAGTGAPFWPRIPGVRMLLSLILWSCASKSVPAEVTAEAVPPSLDAKTGTMVPEVTVSEVPRPVLLPAAAAVTRECFASERRGRTSNSSSGASGTSSRGRGVAAPAASQRSAVATKSLPEAVASPPSPDPMARTMGGTAAAEFSGPADVGMADKDAGAPAKKQGNSEEKARLRLDAGDQEMAPEPIGKRSTDALSSADASRFDWGGTTYLSNDDSMSLASAQRLLWAVENRGPVTTSQIRPHELLNYFSFDTTEVPAGDTFSVMASAEQTGDNTVSLAFAVKGVTPERKPLDLTVVLDRSGSMDAEGRMEYLKRGLTTMNSQLQRGDRLDVVLFDGSICTPLENFVVGRDDPSLFTDVIDALRPRGSTDLNAGLTEGYRVAKSHAEVEGRNRRMLLISDALLNTGEVDSNVVSEIGRSYEQAGIRLSAIGVGRDFNDKVLDQLTEKGQGAYVYLGSEAVVDRVFGAGFDSLVQTVAHDVHFSLDLPPSLALERFYGEESSTTKTDVQPIDYYAKTTQLFVQDLRMAGARPERSDVVKLTAEWTDVDTGAARTQTFSASVGSLIDADARNLHKGRALLAWTDLILARSLGNDPCGEPYTVWDKRAAKVGDDAELAWLDGLTAPLCGHSPGGTKRVAGVPFKVNVDADQVIAEVAMQCDGKRTSESLKAGSRVVRFEARPGDCQVVLYGNVPMQASVAVPSTGGDVRCVVRGGQMSCG